MMDIAALSGQANAAAGAGSSTSVGQKNMVDYQVFLELLVTQMKNQDPTEPMDSTEYIAQLASFSNVEQNVQVNNKLEQLLERSTLGQAASLIGRTITDAAGQGGVVAEVSVSADGMTATLSTGQKMSIDSGVVIS